MKRAFYTSSPLKFSLLLLALLLIGTWSQAQLIFNSSFETWTGACPVNTAPDSWTNYTAGPGLGPDQAGTCAGTVTSHTGDSHMNLVWINSGASEGASQTFTTTFGATYRVSFFARNGEGLYSSNGDVKLELYQNSLVVYTSPNITPGGQWTNYTWEFTTASITETIAIRVIPGTNAAPGSGAAAVDDFTVTELVNVRDAMLHHPHVYPNPVQDIAYISQGDYVRGDLRNVPFRIDNLMGQVVLESATDFTGGNARLDLSALRPGVYVLSFTLGEDKVQQKVVVE